MVRVPLLAILLALCGCALGDDDVTQVSLFGLGAMGCAAAARLATDEKIKLTVWNRSPGKCVDELPASTVTRASTIPAALATADVAILMLTSTEHVLAAFNEEGVAAARARGTTVVGFATVSVTGAATQERELQAKLGADKVISGAMMCAPPGFEEGQCPMWLGGSAEAFAKSQGVLGRLGPAERVHDTAAGAAAYDHALVNSYQHLTNAALASLAMLQRHGIDGRFVADQVMDVLGAILPTIKKILHAAIDRSYDQYVAMGKTEVNIDINTHFSKLSLQECEELGLPSCTLFRSGLEFQQPLNDAGHSALSHAALIEAMLDPSLTKLNADAAKAKKKTEL